MYVFVVAYKETNLVSGSYREVFREKYRILFVPFYLVVEGKYYFWRIRNWKIWYLYKYRISSLKVAIAKFFRFSPLLFLKHPPYKVFTRLNYVVTSLYETPNTIMGTLLSSSQLINKQINWHTLIFMDVLPLFVTPTDWAGDYSGPCTLLPYEMPFWRC